VPTLPGADPKGCTDDPCDEDPLGRSSDALAALRSVERRRLKSGAPAHDFTTEERRRGAQRTNEIKRERAAKRQEAKAEPLDLAEKLCGARSRKRTPARRSAAGGATPRNVKAEFANTPGLS
jgi:hypothetical protein